MFFAENIGNLFYQHPKYEYGKNRFKKVEDYYSLGIVLLEIAFWKTCHDMWQSGRYKSLDRDAFKEKLVEKFVPGLAAVMGTAYRDAVSICLRWEFNADDNERTFSQDTDSHLPAGCAEIRSLPRWLSPCIITRFITGDYHTPILT
jgi:hypothetical protein